MYKFEVGKGRGRRHESRGRYWAGIGREVGGACLQRGEVGPEEHVFFKSRIPWHQSEHLLRPIDQCLELETHLQEMAK